MSDDEDAPETAPETYEELADGYREETEDSPYHADRPLPGALARALRKGVTLPGFSDPATPWEAADQ